MSKKAGLSSRERLREPAANRKPDRELFPNVSRARAVTAPTRPHAGLEANRHRLPHADTAQTDLLWRKVLSSSRVPEERGPGYMRQTESSLSRQSIRCVNDHENSSQTSRSLPLASTRPSSAASTSSKQLPTIYDKTFRQDIQAAYNIAMDDPAETQEIPYESGIEELRAKGLIRSLRECYSERYPGSNVWLEFDQEQSTRMAQQYRNMVELEKDNDKLMHRTRTTFLQEDDIGEVSGQPRGVKTYLKLNWDLSVDEEKHLRYPPTTYGVKNRNLPLNFKSILDCTYWLNVQDTEMTYRNKLEDITNVLPRLQVFAPYLTVEFTKSGLPFEIAENKLLVASSVILYNRFRLRCARLRRSSFGLQEDDRTDSLKHYSILFHASKATFYSSEPLWSTGTSGETTEDIWQGCRTKQLATKDAQRAEDVIAISHWINEIHSYGLGCYYASVKEDIESMSP